MIINQNYSSVITKYGLISGPDKKINLSFPIKNSGRLQRQQLRLELLLNINIYQIATIPVFLLILTNKITIELFKQNIVSI
jgi:hypothetical protein